MSHHVKVAVLLVAISFRIHNSIDINRPLFFKGENGPLMNVGYLGD